MWGRRLAVVENLLAAIPFAVVAVVAFVNVVSRYFFNLSLAFTGELTVNLAIWMVMMGAVIGLREGAHLGFAVLHQKVRGAVRTAMTALIAVAVIVFLVVLLWYGFDLAVRQLDSGRAPPSMDVPQWLCTLALPIGAVFGIYRTIEAARGGFTTTTVETKPSEEAEQ